MATEKLVDFIKEPGITRELLGPRNKLILVIGGPDTGKTTLIECIADLLAEHQEVGVVDLDMGQSHIGMPTTIAWGKIKGVFKDWSDIRTEDFYFTGTLSPPGNLVPALVGAKLITEKALFFCQKVIVDTTGLIAEPAGRVLKQYKIDILSPDIILALERAKELGHILDCYTLQKFPLVYRLSVPMQVELKSITGRAQYRALRFKSYFTNARTHEVSYEDMGIRFTREPIQFSTSELKDTVVSFRDVRNRDLALGIVEGLNIRHKKLEILSPINPDVKFSTLLFGMTKITL